MASPNPGDCGFETPLQSLPRKRLTSYASVTNFQSQKRKRLSTASFDFDKENESVSTGSLLHPESPIDRFVPSRPKMYLPLQITPRTQRIGKQFGLLDDRILSFKPDNPTSSSDIATADDIDTLHLLRQSASSLFTTPPPVKHTSVVENLSKRRQCKVVLDSPNIQPSVDAYPISWSTHNLIAVSCGRDVYYQNLDTKAVEHLCRSPASRSVIWAIEWAGKERGTYLASAMEDGYLQIWDSVGSTGRSNYVAQRGGSLVQMYRIADGVRVTACAWSAEGNVLAAGAKDKRVSIVDIRMPDVVIKAGELHKDRILGLKWSSDENFLTSSDAGGSVYLWDKRAGKTFAELVATHGPRMVHKAPVKALAWCPWKSDLLATGTYSPEGKIRIWNTSMISSYLTEPAHTIPLNTAVYSLQWSPHCKELLSTHGGSFSPILSRNRTPHRSNASWTPTADANTQVKAVPSPLANSITVHDYPSGKRLMSLGNAHSSTISHSCLGPDGENVFTVSPAEETIKMWQVWGKRVGTSKERGGFDRDTIR